MSIPKMTPAKRVLTVTGDYPDPLPRLSDAVLQRVPALQQWQSLLDIWWYEFRSVLMREHDAFQSSLNSAVIDIEGLDGTSEGLAALSVSLAALQAQLLTIVTEQGVQNASISALQASMASLSALVSRVTSIKLSFPSPASEWDLPHTFSSDPVIVLRNTSDQVIGGQISYVSSTLARASFNAALSGSALLKV